MGFKRFEGLLDGRFMVNVLWRVLRLLQHSLPLHPAWKAPVANLLVQVQDRRVLDVVVRARFPSERTLRSSANVVTTVAGLLDALQGAEEYREIELLQVERLLEANPKLSEARLLEEAEAVRLALAAIGP